MRRISLTQKKTIIRWTYTAFKCKFKMRIRLGLSNMILGSKSFGFICENPAIKKEYGNIWGKKETCWDRFYHEKSLYESSIQKWKTFYKKNLLRFQENDSDKFERIVFRGRYLACRKVGISISYFDEIRKVFILLKNSKRRENAENPSRASL